MAGLLVSPVNASMHTWRCTTHDSGSERLRCFFSILNFSIDHDLPALAGALAKCAYFTGANGIVLSNISKILPTIATHTLRQINPFFVPLTTI
jgi:hypothetical protein